jgi:hypothetical protein
MTYFAKRLRIASLPLHLSVLSEHDVTLMALALLQVLMGWTLDISETTLGENSFKLWRN